MRKISMGIGLAILCTCISSNLALANTTNVRTYKVKILNQRVFPDFKISALEKVDFKGEADQVIEEIYPYIGLPSQSDSVSDALPYAATINSTIYDSSNTSNVLFINKMGVPGQLIEKSEALTETLFNQVSKNKNIKQIIDEIANIPDQDKNFWTDFKLWILKKLETKPGEELIFKIDYPEFRYETLDIDETRAITLIAAKNNKLLKKTVSADFTDVIEDKVKEAKQRGIIRSLKNGITIGMESFLHGTMNETCNVADNIPKVGFVIGGMCRATQWVLENTYSFIKKMLVNVFKLNFFSETQSTYDRKDFEIYTRVPSKVDIFQGMSIPNGRYDIELKFHVQGAGNHKSTIQDFEVKDNLKYIFILETN